MEQLAAKISGSGKERRKDVNKKGNVFLLCFFENKRNHWVLNIGTSTKYLHNFIVQILFNFYGEMAWSMFKAFVLLYTYCFSKWTLYSSQEGLFETELVIVK